MKAELEEVLFPTNTGGCDGLPIMTDTEEEHKRVKKPCLVHHQFSLTIHRLRELVQEIVHHGIEAIQFGLLDHHVV